LWSGIDAMMMALINEFSSTTASFTEGHYRLNSTIRLKVILLIICLILDTSAVARKISERNARALISTFLISYRRRIKKIEIL
jgi:hypothetical protein